MTLHRRGISRNGLLADLIASATDDYRRAMWPALTGPGSAAERLFAALEHLCSATEEHMGLLLALPAQADDVFHDGGEEALTRTVFTEPLERLFRDGIADGSLSAGDPEEAATVAFNLVGWTYVHLRSGHKWSPERARRGVLEPLRHGFLVSPPAGGGG